MTIDVSTPFQTGLDATQRVPLYIAKILSPDWGGSVSYVGTAQVQWYDTDEAEWFDPQVALGKSFHTRKSEALTEVNPVMQVPSNLSQQVYPEEGRSSISTMSLGIVDKNLIFTKLIQLDQAAFMQNRKVEIYAGYVGMQLQDFLLAFTGRVKDYTERSTGVYNITLYDPQKATQRDLFRTATEEAPRYFFGNPINLVLAWLTSTGEGNNGNYDWFSIHDGLGIDESDVNISKLEEMRDDFFPGDSHNMYFAITEPIKAKEFLEEQIYKVLNLYPTISGAGEYGVTVFKPPLPALTKTHSFVDTNGDFIGRPKWSPNLQSMINEVRCKYDYDGEDFQSDIRFINAASALYRGAGKKTLMIESEGLKSGVNRLAWKIIQRRANNIFDRWANPPSKITITAPFRKLVIESGDVISITNSHIPDLVAGTRGITDVSMEVLKRSLNAKGGNVRFELLDTGFAKGTYQVISPVMTILAGIDNTSFTVSASDGLKYENMVGYKVSLKNEFMLTKIDNVAIISVVKDDSGNTCTITVEDMHLTPPAGWKVVFAEYELARTSTSKEQKKWGYISGYLEGNRCAPGSCTDPLNNANTVTGWIEDPYGIVDVTLSSEAGGPAGRHCLRLTERNVTNPHAFSNEVIGLDSGDRWVFKGRYRGDGVVSRIEYGVWEYKYVNNWILHRSWTAADLRTDWFLNFELEFEIPAEVLADGGMRAVISPELTAGTGQYMEFADMELRRVGPEYTLGEDLDSSHLIVP